MSLVLTESLWWMKSSCVSCKNKRRCLFSGFITELDFSSIPESVRLKQLWTHFEEMDQPQSVSCVRYLLKTNLNIAYLYFYLTFDLFNFFFIIGSNFILMYFIYLFIIYLLVRHFLFLESYSLYKDCHWNYNMPQVTLFTAFLGFFSQFLISTPLIYNGCFIRYREHAKVSWLHSYSLPVFGVCVCVCMSQREFEFMWVFLSFEDK